MSREMSGARTFIFGKVFCIYDDTPRLTLFSFHVFIENREHLSKMLETLLVSVDFRHQAGIICRS